MLWVICISLIIVKVDKITAEGGIAAFNANVMANPKGFDASFSLIEGSIMVPGLWLGVGTKLFTGTQAFDGYSLSDKGKKRIFEYADRDFLQEGDTVWLQEQYFRSMKSWFPLQLYWIPIAYLKDRKFPYYVSIHALYCPWSKLGGSGNFPGTKGMFGNNTVLDIGVRFNVPFASLLVGYNMHSIKESIYNPADDHGYSTLIHVMPYTVSRFYIGAEFSLGKSFLSSKRFTPEARGWTPIPLLVSLKTAPIMARIRNAASQGHISEICNIILNEKYYQSIIDYATLTLGQFNQIYTDDSIASYIINYHNWDDSKLDKISKVLRSRNKKDVFAALQKSNILSNSDTIMLPFFEEFLCDLGLDLAIDTLSGDFQSLDQNPPELRQQKLIEICIESLDKYPSVKCPKKAEALLEPLIIQRMKDQGIFAGLKVLEKYPASKWCQNDAPIKKLDEQMWKLVKNQDSVAAIDDYLKVFPSGMFTYEANIKLDALTWRQIKTNGTMEEFENYLQKFSSGRWREDAEKRFDDRAWQYAEQQKTVSAYLRYFTSPYARQRMTEAEMAIRRIYKNSPDSIDDESIILMLKSINAEFRRLALEESVRRNRTGTILEILTDDNIAYTIADSIVEILGGITNSPDEFKRDVARNILCSYAATEPPDPDQNCMGTELKAPSHINTITSPNGKVQVIGYRCWIDPIYKSPGLLEADPYGLKPPLDLDRCWYECVKTIRENCLQDIEQKKHLREVAGMLGKCNFQYER